MIRLYCDGWVVKTYKVWLDELDDEIDKLEGQGYVYGYTEQEVNEVKEQYETMLDNIIIRKEEQK